MTRHWKVITREGKQIDNLDDASIRDLVYRHQLHPEDWAAPVGSDQFKQIALLDAFSIVASKSRRHQRKKQAADADMDMTPMIDVVFLLLIFFMITATFHLQTGMGFPPDKDNRDASQPAQTPGIEDFDDRIIVEISELDEFFVKDVGGQSNSVEVDELVDAIRQQGSASNLNKVFVVAHEMASLEAIVKAFDASAEVGISDIALADITTPTTTAPSGPIQIQRN